ncbi:MAG TPA: hypothetical protein VN903_36465, partial [Polyangia bacterium]|nr:hypothetical protein [Polyangia bacterium]
MKTSRSARARRSVATIGLLTFATGVACRAPVADEGAITTERSALDPNDGFISGSVLWAGTAVSPGNILLVVSPSPAPGFFDLNLPGQYASVATPGPVSVDVWSCGLPLRAGPVIVPPAGMATLNIDLTSAQGRVAGSLALRGAPTQTPVFIENCPANPFGGPPSAATVVFDFAFGTIANTFSKLVPAIGTYTLGAPGWGSKTVQIAAGQTTDLGLWDAHPGTIQGHLSWNGAPAPSGTAIEGKLPSSSSQYDSWSAFTGSTGAYSASNLPFGTYATRAANIPCAGAADTGPVTLPPDGSETFDADLTPLAGRVTGTLKFNGVPGGGSIRLACGAFISADATGNFTSGLIGPGTFSGNLFNASGTTVGPVTVTVVAGQTTTFTQAPVLKNDGDSCTQGTECISTYCSDKVCCHSDCGTSPDDCQACSTEAGGSIKGQCTPTASATCYTRPAGDQCVSKDATITCGSNLTCPAPTS